MAFGVGVGILAKGNEKISNSNSPPEEWAQGVRDTVERNGEANVILRSNGSVAGANAGIVHVFTCTGGVCVCHCGYKEKGMQGSCDVSLGLGSPRRTGVHSQKESQVIEDGIQVECVTSA